ncbi:MAG: HAMP domain-containing sensor histidine kinase, partial [Campylobacterota bacterium]|nr:HAMP domain-containing sensor histidine kinase [Campylobacterota bacterium]
IGELLENIAHHWRQPLSVITSTASAMQVSKEFGTLTDESFNNSCNMINNNAQNLSKTIDNFKSFFITDTNKEIFNLKDTIDNYIDLVHTSFEDKNIKIISNIDNIEIDGIKNDFIQILSILFNNSKYALENNEVDNKLIIVDLNKVNDHIVFSVKDNAGGIEEKNINKIFEPYFTTKHAYSGTGLGLYMAHEIVNNSLNGNISAKNLSFESNGYKCFGMQVLIVI